MNFKKILYVIPALMLGSCSADDILQSEADMQQNTVTYTMTADMDDVTSRATYIEEDDCMNVKWEINDVVSVSNGTESYDFYVTKVDANTNKATLSYTGAAIPDASDFTGTATYAPRDAQKVNIQTANDNTEHLKYNETAVATFTNVNLNNASLTFRHEQTAVYKVTFIAPTNIAVGSTLTMSGVGQDATLKLNFSANKDDAITCYIMAPGGTVEEGGTLKFSLEVGSFTYCRSMKCTKAGGVTYENGKYWLASLSNKLELKLINGHEFVDLGITRGDVYGSYDRNANKKIVFATMNIGASTPDGIGYFFRWGEQQGWKVTATSSDATYYNGELINYVLSSDNCAQYDKNGMKTSASLPAFNEDWALYKKTLTKSDIHGLINQTINGQKYGDAATYNWGSPWTMMPYEVARRLYYNSSSTFGAVVLNKSWDSAKGLMIKNEELGTSLFLPVVGGCDYGKLQVTGQHANNYWTSLCAEGSYITAFAVILNSGMAYRSLYSAYQVRAIAEI